MKTIPKPVFHPCDFCKARGILEVHIFNKEGWYFCIPCLQELAQKRVLSKAPRLGTIAREDHPVSR